MLFQLSVSIQRTLMTIRWRKALKFNRLKITATHKKVKNTKLVKHLLNIVGMIPRSLTLKTILVKTVTTRMLARLEMLIIEEEPLARLEMSAIVMLILARLVMLDMILRMTNLTLLAKATEAVIVSLLILFVILLKVEVAKMKKKERLKTRNNNQPVNHKRKSNKSRKMSNIGIIKSSKQKPIRTMRRMMKAPIPAPLEVKAAFLK